MKIMKDGWCLVGLHEGSCGLWEWSNGEKIVFSQQGGAFLSMLSCFLTRNDVFLEMKMSSAWEQEKHKGLSSGEEKMSRQGFMRGGGFGWTRLESGAKSKKMRFSFVF